MRRGTPLKPSTGTGWPAEVREHAMGHQRGCLGPAAGMPGECWGQVEGDHLRASHGMGMKSPSVATNFCALCHWHHSLRTREGRTWRPLLLAVIARLHGECAQCQREAIETYGAPLESVNA